MGASHLHLRCGKLWKAHGPLRARRRRQPSEERGPIATQAPHARGEALHDMLLEMPVHFSNVMQHTRPEGQKARRPRMPLRMRLPAASGETRVDGSRSCCANARSNGAGTCAAHRHRCWMRHALPPLEKMPLDAIEAHVAVSEAREQPLANTENHAPRRRLTTCTHSRRTRRTTPQPEG